MVTTAQKQTPLSGFLVKQTLEERMHAIMKRQPMCSGSSVKDMSASPALRRTVSTRKKGAKSAKKAVEDTTIAKMTPGKVTNIRMFFEQPSLPAYNPTCVVQPGDTDNNSGVCVAGIMADPEMALQVGVCVATAGQPTGSTVTDPEMALQVNNSGMCVAAANQTLAAGTVAYPEMALQVGVSVATAGQPTGSEIEVRSGHMTGAEPMRDEALDPDQDREGSSHFGQDHQNLMDSQGCSAE